MIKFHLETEWKKNAIFFDTNSVGIAPKLQFHDIRSILACLIEYVVGSCTKTLKRNKTFSSEIIPHFSCFLLVQIDLFLTYTEIEPRNTISIESATFFIYLIRFVVFFLSIK